MPTGIDVYTKYQSVRDWSAVRRAGYEYCYVKVSDGGTDRPDGGYGPAGRRAGLAMGGYHYAQPGDPIAQANRLCNRIETAGLSDLAPALDLESPFTPGPVAVAFAVAFLRRVRERGHLPCLYANNAMLSNILPAVKRAVPETVIWVARYGGTPTVPYNVWQHEDKGQVPGVQASSVDLNKGGAIPFNTRGAVPFPATVIETAATAAIDNDEESTVLVPAGTNDHVVIPAVNRPRFLYLFASYGDTVQAHAIDFVLPTKEGKPDGDFVPGAGLVDWQFHSNRPGPVPIPACAGVVLRYTSAHSFTAFVG